MAKLLWTPSRAYQEQSPLFRYQQYIADKYGVRTSSYAQMHDWSVNNLPLFWESILSFFEIKYLGHYNNVFSSWKPETDFTDIKWFSGISVSYSENIFLNRDPNAIAVKYADEDSDFSEFSWSEISAKVSSVQQYLKANDIKQGDRVVGLLNNTVEALVIFLAVNSLGAIWSCCSPDFGDKSIIERFGLIAPKLLFIGTDYQYAGRHFTKSATFTRIKENISSIQGSVVVNSSTWADIFSDYPAKELQFQRVDFDHPIWILYTSGTTGKPKAITHRTGGNLIEHLKALALHQNVQKGENFLWYSTTGWMMWNYALSSLLCGATLCLYNGAIQYKDHRVFWNFVKRAHVDHLGAGAVYFSSIHDLQISDYHPKVIGSTGSPLPEATFENLQHKFPEAHIISLSGGTDVCSAFLSGCSLLPVYAGEIQCRTLGSAIVAINENGEEVIDQVGELIIKQPMPAMPLCFWGDQDNKKYKESYFASSPGVWSHGDWIAINRRGGVEMHGRSDSTLNRGGIRIGTAEIYNSIMTVAGVLDSLVIVKDDTTALSRMILFIQLADGGNFLQVVEQIKKALREQYSPRHVPDTFYRVMDIPYTLSGKKLEIPIKKIFSGVSVAKSVSIDVMRNPSSMDEFVRIYRMDGEAHPSIL